MYFIPQFTKNSIWRERHLLRHNSKLDINGHYAKKGVERFFVKTHVKNPRFKKGNSAFPAGGFRFSVC